VRLSRRSIARLGASAGLGLALGHMATPTSVRAAGPSSSLTPDQALQQLLDGNQRYVQLALAHPNLSAEGRMALAAGQMPFAAVLSCIDSRVPPDIVFDQGLGNIFVGRTAGNIVDDTQLGGLEFAVSQYSVPLIVLLGHQGCGAIVAAISALSSGSEAPGHIAGLVAAIEPAVTIASSQSGDMLGNAIRANVLLGAGRIRDSHPILAEAVASGALKVVGMYYSLDTGAVEVIDRG
jgi:carbonic anhydrase